MASRMQEIISSFKEMIASGTLSETVINRLNQELNTFIEEYNIRDMIVAIVTAIEEVIKQIDLQKLSESSLSFLRDLDVQFDLKAKLEMVVSQLKEFIASFDITEFAEQLKTYISSLNLDAYIQDLVAQFPTNLFGTTVETLKELIQQFDILGKFNTIVAKLRELIVKFEVDQKVEAILEKFVELIKQFKIDETVQVLANNLKAIDMPGKIMQVLENVINYLKATDITQVVEQINAYIDNIVQYLKSFNYNAFADEVNQMISAYSAQANELIQALEIPQKLEAIREFVNFALTTFYNYLEQLSLNYLPVISLPEITLPEFTFPVIPAVPIEKLIETLQIPEFKLPNFPTEFMVPGFGKLYGELKVNSPIYTIRNTAELQSSLDGENARQVTAFVTSQATSPSFEILTFNLDSTARIAVPEAQNVIVAETLKFTHSVLELEHQASVTLKDLAAQASAKTTVKATTTPYTAELVNEAFFATAGGLSVTVDTTYSHMLNIPIIGITSETALTQKAVARQEGTTVTLTLGNEGTAKFNSHDGVHKSDLLFTINPNTAKLTFTSDTDTALLKMKQTLNADSVTLSYIKFEARSEAEGPAVKNSLLVASGNVNLYDMKIELKATHDTELVGTLSGVLSNAVNIVIRPVEVVFDFQNKGNTVLGSIAKIDLQNDYSATFKPNSQKFNTVALARLNQYKVSYNFKVDNNEKEFGIFVDVDGEANLDILATPISIPELNLPFVEIRTPAISDLNLYELTGLNKILTTTEQNVAVATKIVYQKSLYAPLVDVMGLVQIPSVGNLITDLSFKSSIINLNLNAGLYNEEDIVFRLGATTTSEFESLKAKLDGTTSLTTRRGIKLANSLSLENPHIEGTHDSTISVNPDTFEAALSVATVGKIVLPILNLEVSQNLVADTKTKANAVSTLKLKGDFNVPIIKAVGKAEAEQSLKLEATFVDVSMETTTMANIEGTVFEDYPLLAALNNEANLYLNADGLRSTIKVLGNTKFNQGDIKLLEMDLDQSLAIEASLSRVYAVLKIASNNEANVLDFNTNGKHIIQATMDLAPTSSLTADIEIDMSQPSSLGELTIFEKTIVELTAPKQKISANAKIVTPVYTTSLAAELEGDAPVFKVTLKSTATSVFVILDYDLDSAITVSMENAIPSLTGKAVLTHADLIMDIQHVLSQTEESGGRLTLNMDITSPTFTDVSFRYAASRDGLTASLSTPSTGFLGLQAQGRVLSQLNGRVYGRYASAPEDDVDIFIIRASAKELNVAFNMEAPEIMINGLKERLPAIVSTLNDFGEKYQLIGYATGLKSAIVNLLEETYTTVNNQAPELSQLSILFRNTVVQYQKIVQVFLDTAVKFLRETQFKLPGSEEMTTFPEVLKKLTGTIATVLEKAIQMMLTNAELTFNAMVDMLSNVQVTMPVGDVMSGAKAIDQMRDSARAFLNQVVELVRNLESLDMILEKLGETFKFIVDKAQEFVDNSLKSDILDAVAIYINAFYGNLVNLLKLAMDQANTLVDT